MGSSGGEEIRDLFSRFDTMRACYGQRDRNYKLWSSF